MDGTDSEDAATEAEGDYLQEVAYVAHDPEVDDTTCIICHAEFLDSEDLDVHVNQVHKKAAKSTKSKKSTKPLHKESTKATKSKESTYSRVCQFCDATYRDAEAYARHICNDHLVQLYCCRVCTKCFTDGGQCKRHERKHKCKSDMFACSQCTAIFSAPEKVEAHEILNHDNEHDGVLLNCMPQLSALLKQNILDYLHFDYRVLTCTVCKFTSTEIKPFMKHSKACTVFVCDTCCYVTNAKRNLIKHVKKKNRCMGPNEFDSEMTTCPTCKSTVHCRQMHAHMLNCNKYKCYVCDIRFISIDNLSKHQAVAHPVELDVIKCKFCFKEFVGESALERHTKRSHSHQFILYKYKCMTCEQIFKHPQLLFAHYFTKHKELEPYTCRICNKKFKIRKRFTIHIKMEHKSAGVVEFDEQYHVFFAAKKSENPFIPKCVIPELVPVDTSSPSIKIKTQKEINAEIDYSINNDEMPTETELDEENSPSPVEKPKQKPQTRKRKRKTNDMSSSEEEEVAPLSMIKKRANRRHFQKLFSAGTKTLKKSMIQRRQFTCKTCNKYCYTFQNYQNHIQLHKKEYTKCIKCSRSFKSKIKLSEHMANDHASSKLIETLKNVRERKQVGSGHYDILDDRNDVDLTPTERFMKTIKKVKTDKHAVSATIAPSSGDVSVRNFIENFVPEVGEAANVEPKEKVDDDEPAVTLKHYDSPFYRKHSITMTRFIPEPPQKIFKLKMPEKYKADREEKVKLKVKLVQEPLKVSVFDQLESFNNKFSYEDEPECDNGYNIEEYDDCNNDIPEVAQEIMLEGTEEPVKPNLQAPHKIVIPKLPEGYPKIHIATLQPHAPYFKIITVKNSKNANEAIVIDTDKMKQDKPQFQESIRNKDVISLPDGTRFVAANPLAHLLGGTPVEHLQVSNKYYKPTPKNFQGIFAEALQNLDKPVVKPKKPRKKPERIPKRPVMAKKSTGVSIKQASIDKTLDDTDETLESVVLSPEESVGFDINPEDDCEIPESIGMELEVVTRNPENDGKTPKNVGKKLASVGRAPGSVGKSPEKGPGKGKYPEKGPGKSLPIL